VSERFESETVEVVLTSRSSRRRRPTPFRSQNTQTNQTPLCSHDGEEDVPPPSLCKPPPFTPPMHLPNESTDAAPSQACTHATDNDSPRLRAIPG
jgi:hypothetical protein